MPTVIFGGGSVRKHVAAGENGKAPFLRRDAAAPLLPYLSAPSARFASVPMTSVCDPVDCSGAVARTPP